MSGREILDLSCQELVGVVTDYLEGRLPREERTRFETHLCYCPPCRTYLDQFQAAVALSGRVSVEAIRPEQRGRLLEAFRGWNQGAPGRKP